MARWRRKGDDEGERVGTELVWEEVDLWLREYLSVFDCWSEVGVAGIPLRGEREERLR